MNLLHGAILGHRLFRRNLVFIRQWLSDLQVFYTENSGTEKTGIQIPQYYSNPDAVIKCATYWYINGDNAFLDEKLEQLRSIDPINKYYIFIWFN